VVAPDTTVGVNERLSKRIAVSLPGSGVVLGGDPLRDRPAVASLPRGTLSMWCTWGVAQEKLNDFRLTVQEVDPRTMTSLSRFGYDIFVTASYTHLATCVAHNRYDTDVIPLPGLGAIRSAPPGTCPVMCPTPVRESASAYRF
jgi:hypothetical protein